MLPFGDTEREGLGNPGHGVHSQDPHQRKDTHVDIQEQEQVIARFGNPAGSSVTPLDPRPPSEQSHTELEDSLRDLEELLALSLALMVRQGHDIPDHLRPAVESYDDLWEESWRSRCR